MQNFFIYLSSYSLGAARGPHHRSAPENFFIYLYVGPDIRVGNATMGGDCPGISLFISTVRSDGLRCRALRMRAIQNFFIYLSLRCMCARLLGPETFLTCRFLYLFERAWQGPCDRPATRRSKLWNFFIYLSKRLGGRAIVAVPLIAVLEFLYLFELPHLLRCSGTRRGMLESKNFFIYLKSDIFSEARAPRGETSIFLLLLF
jgi:hypothetical protein